MTLEELALTINRNFANLSKLERGLVGYSDEVLQNLASALHCTVSDLFAGEAWGNVTAVPIGSRRIPRISYVQAGRWTAVAHHEPGDLDDWILTDLKLSQGAFALSIRGDSMLPDFREGDTIIVDPEVMPRPGDFVVAKNGEEDATFKKYRPRGINERGDKVFELIPLNDDYETMRSDITPIQIIGTMVEHRRYRKK